MAPQGPIFVIGSGPMIGSHVARHFASQGFSKVALFSRSSERLIKDAEFVKSSDLGVSVQTYAADVTDHAGLTTALNQAVSEVGAPEIVIYNAARIRYQELAQDSSDNILEDFKIPNLGLYTTASVLLLHLQSMANTNPAAHPSLYVTSGAIIHEPLASVFSLCMAKSAQASLVKVLAAQNNDTVHVALVTVGGPVSHEEKENNPTNIAYKFWKLYQQKKGTWETEIRCGW